MPYSDSYTVAMLHVDGADAATTFTDETGKTWTAAGNAQIDTAQKKFGTGSGLFDGTGDYISTPDHADWQLDGGSDANAWTIDFWVRFNGDPGTGSQGLVAQRTDGNNTWFIRLNNNQLLFQHVAGGSIDISIGGAWNPADATWYHITIVKNGTSGYMVFVDGTQTGTTTVDTTTIANLTGELEVGRYSNTAGTFFYLNGWIDELRISKGIARWTANFTPPDGPYNSQAVAVSGALTFSGVVSTALTLLRRLRAAAQQFSLTSPKRKQYTSTFSVTQTMAVNWVDEGAVQMVDNLGNELVFNDVTASNSQPIALTAPPADSSLDTKG